MNCPNCHHLIDQPANSCPNCHTDLANPGKQSTSSRFRKVISKVPPRVISTIVLFGLIGICALVVFLVNFFSGLYQEQEKTKITDIQVQLAAKCEAAKYKEVNPGKIQLPVFGYLMKGSAYFGEDSFLYLEYMNVERWIGDYGSKRPMYQAQTVFCVDADDLVGDSCFYEETGGGRLTFTQRQQRFHGYLIDIKTGNLLGKKTFTGGDPGECDPTMIISKNLGYEAKYDGDTISADEVIDWIKSLQAE